MCPQVGRKLIREEHRVARLSTDHPTTSVRLLVTRNSSVIEQRLLVLGRPIIVVCVNGLIVRHV